MASIPRPAAASAAIWRNTVSVPCPMSVDAVRIPF
jgi:hypothetical protein